MRSLMRRCASCGRYSFKDLCPECKSPTKVPVPARFSPQDHYGRFRREMRKQSGGI